MKVKGWSLFERRRFQWWDVGIGASSYTLTPILQNVNCDVYFNLFLNLSPKRPNKLSSCSLLTSFFFQNSSKSKLPQRTCRVFGKPFFGKCSSWLELDIKRPTIYYFAKRDHPNKMIFEKRTKLILRWADDIFGTEKLERGLGGGLCSKFLFGALSPLLRHISFKFFKRAMIAGRNQLAQW